MDLLGRDPGFARRSEISEHNLPVFLWIGSRNEEMIVQEDHSPVVDHDDRLQETEKQGVEHGRTDHTVVFEHSRDLLQRVGNGAFEAQRSQVHRRASALSAVAIHFLCEYPYGIRDPVRGTCQKLAWLARIGRYGDRLRREEYSAIYCGQDTSPSLRMGKTAPGGTISLFSIMYTRFSARARERALNLVYERQALPRSVPHAGACGFLSTATYLVLGCPRSTFSFRFRHTTLFISFFDMFGLTFLFIGVT